MMMRAVLCGLALLASASMAVADPAFPLPLTDAAAQYLRAISIANIDGTPTDADTVTTQPAPGVSELELALGDAGVKRVTLIARDDKPLFRVEQRFETSLTLMDEGPHMDLLDWKHHVSAWETLPTTDGRHFDGHAVDSDAFPDVSTADIVAAATEAAAHGHTDSGRWIAVARQCRDARSYPCGVGVSTVTLRISVATANGWSVLHTIEMRVPLGC